MLLGKLKHRFASNHNRTTVGSTLTLDGVKEGHFMMIHFASWIYQAVNLRKAVQYQVYR